MSRLSGPGEKEGIVVTSEEWARKKAGQESPAYLKEGKKTNGAL
jgi:hypothetical protein